MRSDLTTGWHATRRLRGIGIELCDAAGRAIGSIWQPAKLREPVTCAALLRASDGSIALVSQWTVAGRPDEAELRAGVELQLLALHVCATLGPSTTRSGRRVATPRFRRLFDTAKTIAEAA